VQHVVEALKSLLFLLEEMRLEQSLQAAAAFRPMLKEMETFLAGQTAPGSTLLDPFAEWLVAVSKRVAAAVRQDLAMSPSGQSGSLREAATPS
jgi:hypothetical protein